MSSADTTHHYTIESIEAKGGVKCIITDKGQVWNCANQGDGTWSADEVTFDAASRLLTLGRSQPGSTSDIGQTITRTARGHAISVGSTTVDIGGAGSVMTVDGKMCLSVTRHTHARVNGVSLVTASDRPIAVSVSVDGHIEVGGVDIGAAQGASIDLDTIDMRPRPPPGPRVTVYATTDGEVDGIEHIMTMGVARIAIESAAHLGEHVYVITSGASRVTLPASNGRVHSLIDCTSSGASHISTSGNARRILSGVRVTLHANGASHIAGIGATTALRATARGVSSIRARATHRARVAESQSGLAVIKVARGRK